MIFGTLVQTIILAILTLKTDWDEQVRTHMSRYTFTPNYELCMISFREDTPYIALCNNIIRVACNHFTLQVMLSRNRVNKFSVDDQETKTNSPDA